MLRTKKGVSNVTRWNNSLLACHGHFKTKLRLVSSQCIKDEIKEFNKMILFFIFTSLQVEEEKCKIISFIVRLLDLLWLQFKL